MHPKLSVVWTAQGFDIQRFSHYSIRPCRQEKESEISVRLFRLECIVGSHMRMFHTYFHVLEMLPLPLMVVSGFLGLWCD